MSKPVNVEEIARRAQEYDYNPLVPLRYWLRTAGSLLKEAEIYEHEGNDEEAYLLLFRHAQLVLTQLSKHPDAKDQNNKVALLGAEMEVQKNLARLEVLKPRINKRYDRYTQLVREREARKPDHYSNHNGRHTNSSSARSSSADNALSGRAQQIEAGEHSDLAVKLAQKELSRRATARNATLQTGSPQDEGKRQREANDPGSRQNTQKRGPRASQEDLTRRIQEVRSRVELPRVQDDWSHAGHRPTRYDSPQKNTQSKYSYPSVPTKSSYQPYVPPAVRTEAIDEVVPTLPPKHAVLAQNGSLPARPEKAPLPPPPRPSTPSADLHPSTFMFKPSAYLENGTPLRTIFLPPTLRSTFLSVARPNTLSNLETCGILCGTLISNALFVSRLIIPDQESTSDTCETKDESTLFDYCDNEDLLMLGWIHTHPTQTCFMSSRDLHTHFAYQVMMPESIAIVCAPSKGEPDDWGIFRLTDPPGMGSIRDCRQTGLFHPHKSGEIYTGALRPGHVVEAKGLEFGVVDLRPGH